MTIQKSIVERAEKSNWHITSESRSKEQFILKKSVGYTQARMVYKKKDDTLCVRIMQQNHYNPFMEMEIAELTHTRVNQFFNHIDNMIHRFITYYTKEDFYNE